MVRVALEVPKEEGQTLKELEQSHNDANRPLEAHGISAPHPALSAR
jgi:hypothetical protein